MVEPRSAQARATRRSRASRSRRASRSKLPKSGQSRKSQIRGSGNQVQRSKDFFCQVRKAATGNDGSGLWETYGREGGGVRRPAPRDGYNRELPLTTPPLT